MKILQSHKDKTAILLFIAMKDGWIKGFIQGVHHQEVTVTMKLGFT